MKKSSAVVLGLFLSLPLSLLANTIYVDADASGTGDGTSWMNAFPLLQDALASANSGDDIWVADGSYYPDEGIGQTNNERESTFLLTSGVALYGGFSGSESSLSERSPSTHVAILSGDLEQDDEPDFGNNRDNAFHVLTGSNTDSTAVLDGFTIEAGNGFFNSNNIDDGGGLYLDEGSPSVANCFFLNNSADRGGAIYAIRSSSTITSCTFQGNSSRSEGGAMYNNTDSSTSVINCVFLDNDARTNGGAVTNFLSPALFTNCSFQGNTSLNGGGAVANLFGSPTFINCSYQGNESGSGGGALFNLNSTPSLINCVLWNNSAGGTTTSFLSSVANSSDPTGAFSASYRHCLIQNFTKTFLDNAGSDSRNNLSPSDPLFVSDTDLRLQPTSPAIDTGDSFANSQSLDLDANPRFASLATDLGAYESQQISAPKLADLFFPSSSGAIISVPSWAPDTSPFNSGTGLSFDFSVISSSLTFTAPPSVSSDGTLSFRVPSGSSGSASFTVTVSDPSQIIPDFPPATFNLSLGDRIFVNSTATGNNSGSSWNDALLSLQDALTLASPTHQIWVAEGTYYPDEGTLPHVEDNTATFQLKSQVALYGGFAGNESLLSERDYSAHPTILSGDLDQNDDSGDGPDATNNTENSYHVLTSIDIDSSAILDGFTITGGSASGSVRNIDIGGGLFNFGGSPALENCTFRNNFASDDGGAIFSSSFNKPASFPSLTNCVFLNNSADDTGGAIYSADSSSFSITDCFFEANSGRTGGAIYNESSCEVSNCSFQGNSSSGGGGAIVSTSVSSLEVTDSLFEGNSSFFRAGAISLSGPFSSLTRCIFENNSSNLDGGALSVSTSDNNFPPAIRNCSFVGNSCDNDGGAIYISTSSPTLFNCAFQGNSSNGTGGAIYTFGDFFSESDPSFTNCSFQGNTAAANGGALFNEGGTPSLINSILWNNSALGSASIPSASFHDETKKTTFYSCLIQHFSKTVLDSSTPNSSDNLEPSNPLFVNATDLSLQPGSPAIDTGDSFGFFGPFDLAGNVRIQNRTIDVGAYEGVSAVIDFLNLFPALDPAADDNNNGLSNFVDYALGGDPTAPHNSSLQPELIGNQLAFSSRNSAADVAPLFKVSTTLLSDDWEDLILGTDYTLSNETTNGSQVVQTLELSEALLDNDRLFFRQEFSEPAP